MAANPFPDGGYHVFPQDGTSAAECDQGPMQYPA
jgi:hypothetical protein